MVKSKKIFSSLISALQESILPNFDFIFFSYLLLSLAILKYRQYLLMLEKLKLNNKKQKKSLFYKEKSLVGLTHGLDHFAKLLSCNKPNKVKFRFQIFAGDVDLEYNFDDHVKISPNFYKQLFRTKVLRAAFLYLNFRFELFLEQEYWRKCAHKMLVKLTTEPCSASRGSLRFCSSGPELYYRGH